MTTGLKKLRRKLVGEGMQKLSDRKSESYCTSSHPCWPVCKRRGGGARWLPPRPEKQPLWADPPLLVPGHRVMQDAPCWAEPTAKFLEAQMPTREKQAEIPLWEKPSTSFVTQLEITEKPKCAPNQQNRKQPQGQMGKSMEKKMCVLSCQQTVQGNGSFCGPGGERTLRQVCPSSHPASGPESVLWAPRQTGHGFPAVMTAHGPPSDELRADFTQKRWPQELRD